MKNLLPKIKTAFNIYTYLTKEISVDEIANDTAIAANVWALGIDEIGEEPFPSIGQDDRVLSDAFDISGSGYVWFQRQFRLLHTSSGIESRWINGRVQPQEVVKIN